MTPTIAITIGDPSGIGPEIIARMAAEPSAAQDSRLIVIGDCQVMRQVVETLKLKIDIVPVEGPGFETQPGCIPVLELSGLGKETFRMGTVNRWCGELSYQAVVKAVELARSGEIDAIVTAPISKEAWHEAGHPYDGHTELLAELTGCDNYRMTFVSETLNVMLTTTHIPLCQVCEALSANRIEETISMGNRFLHDLGIQQPRIAVCGVNPHAGESGIFGDEEERLVTPAIYACNRQGMTVCGPLPADTVFLRAARGEFDLVIAHYHDQGLIPIKMVAFETAVNISVGMPVIRTSVDHGTAFDIAGKGIADHGNLCQAFNYALKLASVKAQRGKP